MPAPHPITIIPSGVEYYNNTVAAVLVPSGSYTTAPQAQFTAGAGIMVANIAVVFRCR